jgi:tRNA (guanine37-N1)-methyltransferase
MGQVPNSESAPSSKSSSEIRFQILTLFPEVFGPFLSSSLIGKACAKGLACFDTIQIRDFSKDKHRSVDDTPYGGGEGMLLKVDVLHAAWESACAASRTRSGEKPLTILLSPQGPKLTQSMAKELTAHREIILVCGHYEGVDERFIELCVDREVSIGDYVLTGGELPAMVLAEAVTRLLPGVVGNEQSITQDSLEGDQLKYPQYTRPREFQGLSVPDVLLSGDHQAIAKWREKEGAVRTQNKRPDLKTKR